MEALHSMNAKVDVKKPQQVQLRDKNPTQGWYKGPNSVASVSRDRGRKETAVVGPSRKKQKSEKSYNETYEMKM